MIFKLLIPGSAAYSLDLILPSDSSPKTISTLGTDKDSKTLQDYIDSESEGVCSVKQSTGVDV